MAYYESAQEILASMIEDHAYFTGLAGSPVNLNPTDYGRDEVIKYLTFAGALSQFTATLDQIALDIFPASSTTPGLINHLADDGLPTQIPAQPATVQIQRSGTPGLTVGVDDQMVRSSDATFWVATEAFTIGSGGTGFGTYQSVQDGQAQNSSNIGDVYTAVTATPGVSSTGASTSYATGGRDLETPTEMLARIQAFEQGEDTGGNRTWYETAAQAASNLVTAATASRVGPGQVQVVITSGTTDILTALQSGDSVERQPSSDLIATVLAYILSNNPTTDDNVTVIGPTEASFNLTFNYDLIDEIQRTAVDPQIKILLQYFIYTMIGGSTYYPTDVERLIQGQLGYLIRAMRCQNLGGGAVAYTAPSNTLPRPGTITTGTWS